MSLVVVAHDAGGAEVLSSYVRYQKTRPLLVLEGPARAVFSRKLGELATLTLEDAIAQAAQVLCGTSWQSNLEFNAMQMARATGKHCTAFLDHWINYAERFIRSGRAVQPDELWVGDAIAAEIARRQFPNLPVRVVDNPYFRDIRSELAALEVPRVPVGTGLRVLYVCEPVRDHALLRYGNEKYFGYVEEDALRFFLTNTRALGARVERILIRPHPSESLGKYAWTRTEFDLPIEFGGRRTLVEEIAECDVVVGCESMAMVVGLLAKKRVVSCIPTGGKPCGLPQPEIEHLTRLVPRCDPLHPLNVSPGLDSVKPLFGHEHD